MSTQAVATEFYIDATLPSVRVTRELLNQLQAVVDSVSRDFIGVQAASKEHLRISIDDSHGTERFRSPDEIPTSRFPETTHTLRFDFECSAERALHARFVFAESTGGRVDIRLRGPMARDRAIGLHNRVIQLLEPNRIGSKLFRRGVSENSMYGLATFILFGWMVIGISDALSSSATPATGTGKTASLQGALVPTALWLSVVLYGALTKRLYPLCAFDSAKWDRLSNWRTWATQGFWGLVVFDVVAIAGIDYAVRMLTGSS